MLVSSSVLLAVAPRGEVGGKWTMALLELKAVVGLVSSHNGRAAVQAALPLLCDLGQQVGPWGLTHTRT
jgi:hypothetical protein